MATVSDDDDIINEVSEEQADAAAGFTARRRALREELRRIWMEHEQLLSEEIVTSPMRIFPDSC